MTILQSISKNCDLLPEKVKKAKEASGQTIQEIADATGVPYNNLARFLAGKATNPSAFNLAAVCLHLGLSLDALFGIYHNEHEENVELHRQQAKHFETLYKSEHDTVKFQRVLICVLVVVLLIYVLIFDVGNSEFGFFRR